MMKYLRLQSMIETFNALKKSQLLELYPEIEINNAFQLNVSDGHSLYVEESGNPKGIPAIYVHGGPGGGSQAYYRQFFDPEKYRIILFDQRGCGKSEPYATTEDNTTWKLVDDMERIREELKIDGWVLCGGSWGSTLSLAYAISHPTRVRALVLRGIFLLRKKEINWFYQYGASEIYPEAWETFKNHIPTSERDNFLKAYHKRLHSTDAETRQKAAQIWSTWEGMTSQIFPEAQFAKHYGEEKFAQAFARIETHYFINGGFFKSDNFLLENTNAIHNVPCYIIQGRYDIVCPPTSAWELYQALPQAKMTLVQDAGHTASEPGIRHKIIEALNQYQ